MPSNGDILLDANGNRLLTSGGGLSMHKGDGTQCGCQCVVYDPCCQFNSDQTLPNSVTVSITGIVTNPAPTAPSDCAEQLFTPPNGTYELPLLSPPSAPDRSLVVFGATVNFTHRRKRWTFNSAGTPILLEDKTWPKVIVRMGCQFTFRPQRLFR
jgi:hypothetical protein